MSWFVKISFARKGVISPSHDKEAIPTTHPPLILPTKQKNWLTLTTSHPSNRTHPKFGSRFFQIRQAELIAFVFIPNYTQMLNKSAGRFSPLCGYSMLLLLDINSHCLLRHCLKVTRCVCTFAPNSFFCSEVELPGSMLIRILNFTADSMSFYCCHTFASCFWATSLYLPGR